VEGLSSETVKRTTPAFSSTKASETETPGVPAAPSSSTIVIWTFERSSDALLAPDRYTPMPWRGSSTVSSSRSTRSVAVVWPAAKTMVPSLSTKSGSA